MAYLISNKVPKLVGTSYPYVPYASLGLIAAQTHYNRVVADGGVLPAGVNGLASVLDAVVSAYSITSISDLNTKVPVLLDPHYSGYKLGAGSGTTLGQAATKVYSLKADIESNSAGAYFVGSGVNGNYCSTPNAAANQITGDIEIILKLNISDISAGKNILGKFPSPGNYQYEFALNTNKFSFFFSQNGTTYTTINSNSIVGIISNNTTYFIKFNRVASTGAYSFSYSIDGVNYTTINSGTSTSGSMYNGNATLEIGAAEGGAAAFNGKIYRVTIANSIGGTPVVDFDPTLWRGPNTWTSRTSEIWTINSTGANLADVTQATAASQPLLLAHSGINYYWASGVASNYCSTPNATANQIINDIEIIVKFELNALTAAGSIVGKWGGTTCSFDIYYNANNTVTFYTSTDGATLGGTISSSLGITINTPIWLKVTRVKSSGTESFYTSTDGVNWTAKGSGIRIANQSLYNSTQSVTIGADNLGANNPITVKVYRATIANSIGGTPVVDFNPASYSASTSQTAWTSSTGEVWTINTGTAATGYKGVMVDRTTTQADGIDDSFSNATFALSATGLTEYVVRKKYISTAGSGYAIVLELGTNTNTQQGICLTLNEGADTTYNSIRGDIAKNSSTFNDSSISLLLSTSKQDVSQLAANETDYYAINNTPLTRVITGTGNNTSMSSTGLYLIARGGTVGFANIRMNTIIISSSADNNTVRTAIYNTIRSMNNNAF